LNGSISCETNSTVVDRLLPDCRPIPFSPHRFRCRNHPHTAPTTLHVAYSGHTRRQEISSKGCSFVDPIASQTSTVFDRLQRPTVDALHAGLDGLASISTEFESPPKDSATLMAERPKIRQRFQRLHQSPLATCGVRTVIARMVMLWWGQLVIRPLWALRLSFGYLSLSLSHTHTHTHTHTQRERERERERETTSKFIDNVSLGLRLYLAVMFSQASDQPFGIPLSLPQCSYSFMLTLVDRD
jgi:hypothetical protein